MSIRILMRNREIPDSIKFCFKKTLLSESAEQELWREVIIRQVLDAYGDLSHDPDGNVADARRWFKKDYDDVEQVFALAGMDPKVIVEAVEQLP